MKRRVAEAKTKAEVSEDVSERSARDAKFKSLRGVAEAFTGFRHATEALPLVRAVPTIFPQFDQVTKVGGFPIERIALLHGESSGGKTYFTLAMILSFLMRDHMGYLIDAERTTPASWVEKIYGGHDQHPFFFADRPDSYEQIRIDVRRFCNTVMEQRKKGKIAKDTTALIVIDSIRKLIPAEQFKMIMAEVKKAGKEPIEKARTRIAQIKAQMHAAWTDELVPLLERTGCAMIVIAREIEDPDNTNEKARKAKTNVKTGGGKAWFYDASLDIRTTKAGLYGKKSGGGDEGEDEKFDVWGQRYCISITKTKVSGQGEDFRAKCFFHISNGKISPEGFDRAKDVVELAKHLKLIQVKGSWFKYANKKWQGEERILVALNKDPALLAGIEAKCRACFKLEKTRAA